MTDRSNWFVNTDWLAQNLKNPNVVIVDGSWHLPTQQRDARAEYEAEHIPGAVFFDIDAVADTANPLPHMLPSSRDFAKIVGALGINERQKIVVYDSVGLSSAPRVWWTFKVMGAKDVVILDGGLPKWKAEDRPLTSEPAQRAATYFETSFNPRSVKNLSEVQHGVSVGAFQVGDARAAARFRGEAPEPRSWVKSGRIPGSFSLPSGELVADGSLKAPDAVRAAFEAAGIDVSRPVVTSCGSGVNAAILSLALDTIGASDTALYDGSWTEWGARDDTEIETG